MKRLLRRCLATSMDAIVLNEDQNRAIYNASPEIDSLRERIEQLRGTGIPDASVEAMLADCDKALLYGGLEHGHLRRINGHLDGLLQGARDGIQTTLGVKSLAKAVRPLLDQLADPLARSELHRLLARHSDLVDRPSLAHELGVRRMQQLTAELAHVPTPREA